MGWVVYGIVIVRMMHYALEREYSWTIKRVSGKACRVTLQGDATTSRRQDRKGGIAMSFLMLCCSIGFETGPEGPELED